MNYRGFIITPAGDNAGRWFVRDSSGAVLVSRPSQEACTAWADRYLSYLQLRVERPSWRAVRPPVPTTTTGKE
jgi:hypothetical protein